MPDTLTARDAFAYPAYPDSPNELESRAGAESLEELQQARRDLLTKLAPLKALHGPFGLFDARRKQMLEALKIQSYHQLVKDGEHNGKPPEWRVDAEAHGDPMYATTIDNAVTDRIEYLTLETELSALEERIRSREAELFAYGREIRMGG